MPVFLALTRPGLDDLTRQLGRSPSPLWVNQGVLSAEEVAALRARGADVSTFSFRIEPDDSGAIEGVLRVIAEHHVGQPIWVEHHSKGFG